MQFIPRYRRLTPLALTLALATAGCGATSYSASSHGRFTPETEKAINDDDVRAAFGARPQIGATSRVAYYIFDDEKAEQFGRALGSIPSINSVSHIPTLFVTGAGKFDYVYRDNALNVTKLRLLAARAQADLLILLDYGYRGGGVNGLAAFNFLFLPALFLPFLDNTTESYASAWVFDVRNGYLYGEANSDAKSGPAFATVYADNPRKIFDAQWPKLQAELLTKLASIITPAQSHAVAH
jgi:hypothetical protein